VKREDIHRAWAPETEPWARWVKPVVFAAIDEDAQPTVSPETAKGLRQSVLESLAAVPGQPYRQDRSLRDVALVIDLPGAAGVLAGLDFVSDGFRPIPLYNAVPDAFAVVDLTPIMAALVNGAARVADMSVGALPAFLLDANRMVESATPGNFDNRSICRATDFPSAETLWRAGIRRAVLIHTGATRPAADLEPVLCDWQAKGITLWFKRADLDEAAVPRTLRRRFWLVRAAHAFQHALLNRRADDTYGMVVPSSSS